MALIPLVSLFLVLNFVAGASSTCPQFHKWPGTSDANGELVCAHVFDGHDGCSQDAHMASIVQSQLYSPPRPSSTDGYRRYYHMTFFIRPGCKVIGWSPDSRSTQREFTDNESYMTQYDREGWNFTCECFVRDVKFLTCEPREDSFVVQECDFRNSSHVGVCPFTLEGKPFRAYDLSAGRRRKLKQELSKEELDAVRAVLGPLVNVRFDPFDEDPNVKTSLVRYVPPKNKLIISQRLLVCGSYVAPMPEIDLRHEIYDTASSVVSEVRGIPAGSETDERKKCNNNMDCHDDADCEFNYNADDYVCQCRHGYIGDGSLDCSPEKSDVTSDAWIPFENLNKSFYLSSTNASRANASEYCHEQGGRLADLDHPKVERIVRDLVQTYFTPRLPSTVDTQWWTAAENHVVHFDGESACFLKWPGNRIREGFTLCDTDNCAVYYSSGQFRSHVECDEERRFICEKDGPN